MIPNNVTNLGSNVFQYCTSLSSVTIPSSVTSLGDEAFYSCTSLTSFTIGTNITSIGNYLLYSCTSLTNCTIGTNVTSIGNVAFGGCTNLTSITIPNSVTNIGDWAFFYCTSLTNITIPDGVTSIGNEAFEDCSSLTAIAVDTNNPDYGSVAGVLFNNSLTTLVEYPGGMAGSYTIPNSVTSIGTNAFSDCTGLTSIAIPDSVTNIGNSAFAGCTGLTNITIGSNVASIEDSAFSGCSGLTSVYFQGNSPSLGSDVFDYWVYYYNYGYQVWDPATIYYLPATTGWDAFSANSGLPTSPWLPEVLTSDASFGVQSNGFGFNITWASGQTVVVEACTNLAGPVWLPIQTTILTNGSCYFSDPQWMDYPGRFYRLSSP